MIRIITSTNIAVSAHYLAAFAALRHRVFIERLGWDLPTATTSKGFEYDRFDTADTIYIVICDEQDCVIAGLRLLRTTRPCPLFDCFPDLAKEGIVRSDRVLEVSRFVVDPKASRDVQNAALVRQLLWGLFTYGLEEGFSNFVSVSYAGMERMLRAAGCQFRRLGLPRSFDGRQAAALAFDITEEVVAAIEGRLVAPCQAIDTASVETVIAGQATSTVRSGQVA